MERMENRSVSPVISVILMVAIVVILAAVISVAVLGFTEDLSDPAPIVADTTGEFEIEGDWRGTQIVQITHEAGEDVAVEQIEIVVRATGPDVDTEARLVDLPAEGTTFDTENLEDPDNLIDNGNVNRNNIIIDDDSNVWAAGDTITFRVNTGTADFREGEDPEADELEVLIIHTPSNSVLSEHTITP